MNCKLKEIMKLLSKTNYANIKICILTYSEQEWKWINDEYKWNNWTKRLLIKWFETIEGKSKFGNEI